MRRARRGAAGALLVVVAWSCGQDEERPEGPGGTDATGPATGWIQDYPVEVRLSPRVDTWYDASPAAALDGIAQRLQGHTSHESWTFARLYFERAGEEAVRPLVGVLERGMRGAGLRHMARNACEALARLRRPEALPALLRAAVTDTDGRVGEAAVRAIAATRGAEEFRRLWRNFEGLANLTRLALVQGSVEALGQEAAGWFALVLKEPALSWLWESVVAACEKLPAQARREALDEAWDRLRGPLRFHAACVLHNTGHVAATAEVLGTLSDQQDPRVRAQAVQALAREGLERHLDRVLAVADDDSPAVQLAVLDAVADVPGEAIDRLVELRVHSDDPGVKRRALEIYRKRGLRGHLDRLLVDLRERSGTAFRHACEDLVHAGDTRALPVLVERLKAAEGPGKRIIFQAIARMPHADAITPLVEAFLAPPQALGEGPGLQSVPYAAVLLANIEASEETLRKLFQDELDEDPHRRAHILGTLANIAGVTENEERRARIQAFFRSVALDRARPPQERLLALDAMRRSITIPDAMALKEQLGEEEPGMRRLLNNWLWEFFGPP